MNSRRAPAFVLGCLLVVGMGWAPPAQAQDSSISLKVGAKKAVSVANVTRVAVGDPAVADIRVGGGDLLEVTGRSAGSTQLHVWRADGQKVSFVVTVTR